MTQPPDAVATANSAELAQHQQAGFLLLAVVPESNQRLKDVDDAAEYRLELADKRKRAVLKSRAGHTLVDRADGAHTDGKGCTLLQAVGRQVVANGLEATAQVVRRRKADVLVRLEVSFPLRLWARLHIWKRSPMAAFLFGHLHPLDEEPSIAAPPDGESATGERLDALTGKPVKAGSSAAGQPTSEQKISLADCVAELPSIHSHKDAVRVPPPPQPAPGRPSLLALPEGVLRDVLKAVAAPRDLAAIAGTCRMLRSLAADVPAGLRLKLKEHQEVGVRWMLQREALVAPAPHPTVRQFRTAQGLPLWLCAGTGEAAVEAPPPCAPCRGGFVCDEPGLGKTVTCMALILKTLGQPAAAPPGVAAHHSTDRWGRRCGYYDVRESDEPASCFHSPNRSRRRSGDLPELAPLHPVEWGGWAVAPPVDAEQQPNLQHQPAQRRAQQQQQQSQQQAELLQQQRQHEQTPLQQAQREQLQQQPALQRRHSSAATPTAAKAGAILGADLSSPRRRTRSAAASTDADGGGISGRRKTRSAGAGAGAGNPVPLPSALKRSPAPKRRSPAKAASVDAAKATDATASTAATAAAAMKGSQPAAAAAVAAATAAAAGPSSSLSTDTAEWRVQPTLGQSAGAGEEAASPPAETSPPAKRRRRVCFAQQPDDVPAAGAQAAAVPLPSGFNKGLRSPCTAVDALSGRRVPLNPEAATGGAAAEPGAVEVPVEVVADAGLSFSEPAGCTAAAIGGMPASAVNDSPPAAAACSRDAAASAGVAPAPPMPLPLLPPPSPPPQPPAPNQQDQQQQSQPQQPTQQQPEQQQVPPPQHIVQQPGQQPAPASSPQPGFLAPGQAPGQAPNVMAFRAALLGCPAAARRHSAAWWLARYDPEILATKGMSVPRLSREPENYSSFFTAIGLTEGRRPRRPGERGGQVAPGMPVSPTVAEPHRWVQPPKLQGLRLDTAALQAALRAGPAAAPQKVYLSPATLVVVPAPLIGHWMHQLATHTRGGLLRVAVLGEGSAKDATPAELAWGHDVVLTTFTRLSAEWSGDSGAASALRQVHWLRVILDEGHKVGGVTLTNKLAMAANLRAERRWVVTGTPTPGSGASEVSRLHPLLTFLRHQPYGGSGGRRLWEEAVQKPFEAGRPEGRAQLTALLRETMIRAAKSAIRDIPKCTRKVTLLDFEEEHARSYNELVEVIRLNLLLADWDDDDHVESLLAEKNSKWGREYLQNVKLSCCVAGNQNLTPVELQLKETLELLAERHDVPPPAKEAMSPPWLPHAHPLSRIEVALRHGGPCDRCAAVARLLVVTPCAHLLCVGCAGVDREACPLEGCRKAYTMQAVGDPERLKTNPRPKWPVPQEIIEWQPSYVQRGAVGISGGEWSANWQMTRSTKCAYLLSRLRAIGAALQTAPASSFQAAEAGADAAPTLENSSAAAAAAVAATVMAAEGRDAASGGVGAADADVAAGAAFSVAAAEAAAAEAGGGSDAATAAAAQAAAAAAGSQQKPLKAIVFSQFWMHLQLIAATLTAGGVNFAMLQAHLKPDAKAAALARFQDDPACTVLVMDETGSVGLDLSFAGAVFLMEPLADAALEQQVVARAHRMGADPKRPIAVETLVMKGTAEEDILHGISAGTAGQKAAAGDARRTRNALFRALHRAEGVRRPAVVG